MTETNLESESIRLVEAKIGDVKLPMGYVLTDAYGPRFRPNVIALLSVLTPFMMVAGWAIPRIIKSIKKKVK